MLGSDVSLAPMILWIQSHPATTHQSTETRHPVIPSILSYNPSPVPSKHPLSIIYLPNPTLHTHWLGYNKLYDTKFIYFYILWSLYYSSLLQPPPPHPPPPLTFWSLMRPSPPHRYPSALPPPLTLPSHTHQLYHRPPLTSSPPLHSDPLDSFFWLPTSFNTTWVARTRGPLAAVPLIPITLRWTAKRPRWHQVYPGMPLARLI